MADRLQLGPSEAVKEDGSAASSALVIEGRDGKKLVIPFGEEIVIGRGGQGTTVRLHERDVSRRHARFSRSNGALWVEDLGSFNGTWVNGDRIQSKRRIREGDLIQLGGYDIAVLGTADLPQDFGLPVPPDTKGGQPATEAARKVAAGSRAAARPSPPRQGTSPCPADLDGPVSTSRGERGIPDTGPEPRRARTRVLLAIGAASLLLGWTAGRLLRPVLHPAGPAAVNEVRR